MVVIDQSTPWPERAYYFCGELNDSVVIKLWMLRTEAEYDNDETPQAFAMRTLKRCIERSGQHAWLLTVSDIAQVTPSRTRKGVLWGHSALKTRLEHSFEKRVGNDLSRLGAMVNLADFSFDSSADLVLDWGRSMVVLGQHPWTVMSRIVEGWVSCSRSDVLGYDYDAIGRSLQEDAIIGFMRYLPPSNGRREAIVVVANRRSLFSSASDIMNALY